MRILIFICFFAGTIFIFSCSELSTGQNITPLIKISFPEEDLENPDEKNHNEITVNIHKNHLLGKFNPIADSMFVQVPSKYCAIRTEYLHKEVLNPFIRMYEAAAKEGIYLKIISATRTFNVQKSLWNQKFYYTDNPKQISQNILCYLAMPGTSRHHWGTEIDILSTKLSYFETAEGKRAYNWLVKNAEKFGFYQVYTSGRETGYYEEKWHWSYLPISKEFQKQYKTKITYEDLGDFMGFETAKALNVIDDYVFGIDNKLLD